ncbi:hypothetical protein N665_2101s0003 [Sinapis alba]|nr:hypothetical protein N665_2101s0003 [Sinapis alba]
MDFGWASRLVHYMICFQLNIKKKYELWSLVGADPYIEHLENPRCEVTKEMASFWERIGVSVDVGPSSEQIIRALKRCQEWSQDDRMRLGYVAIFSGFVEGRKYSSATRASLARLVMDLEKFENYPWGRVAFKVLMDFLRAKDFTKSYTVDGFIQVLQVWIYNALSELGTNYGNPLPNKPSPPLLASKGGKGRKCFKDAISRHTRVINYVEKNIEEIFPKWDNDKEDVSVENIIQVMFNAPPNWKWTMNCWEDEGIYPWTNLKMHVVYVKEESFVKSLVVREEDIERPSKRARIEAPAEPRSEDIPDARSGAIPDARSEASIPVSGVDKAYIEKCFKDLTNVMRDGFGTCLKEMKLLGNRMDVVEKKMGITGKENFADDLQQTTSSLPKRRLEHGSESVNGAKARQDEEPSSSKALSVEAKEKEVKEGKEKELKEKELKEKELKEKASKGLEKALAKAKEAKANEAKANEAKTNEAKAKEAKAKEAKAKEKEAKEKNYQENNTAKLIIPNTKVGHGYDPFALPDKQLTKALMEHVKKDPNWRKSFDRKPNRCLSYWYQVSLLLGRLHRRLSRRLTCIVPTFCATNKTWDVDIDEIYAPVNFQNDHWIAIWISIPKRHIVVWDNIVKHISKAQLDEIIEPFLTMVPYLLVECASTDEERIKYSLEPFRYERPTVGVPQCIAGDCGVYALKYMECHALGYTSFHAAFFVMKDE